MQKKEKAELTDVPETMLWTLYNRATECQRKDSVLRDPTAVSIFNAIDYDYKSSFGKANPVHALRSLVFDGQLEHFLSQSKNAVIVNLGEGLETQRFRVSAPEALWLTVDLPESIEIRERFIQPDEQHRHVALSALDREWFDAVPEGRDVIVTAQGLLMYFEPEQVRALLHDLIHQLKARVVVFDAIPRWFSRKTVKGFRLTRSYTTPSMPWGINGHEVQPLIAQEWLEGTARVSKVPFPLFPRGLERWASWVWMYGPWIRNRSPSVIKIEAGRSSS